jgi:hypothetical protein
MTSRPSLIRLLPYVILLAEVVLFHRRVLFSDYVIPWDLRGFHLPHAHLYADALGRGELPLWDPYTYCGRPFQANIQTAVFYPTVAVAAAIGSLAGHHHLEFLLELNVIFHVFLAGIFAYRFGRTAGLSPPAALVAGTAYQLGGFFAAHAEHVGAVAIAALLPLALDSVLRLSRDVAWRRALPLAATLALAVLAGHTPLTAVVYAICLLFAFLVDRRSPRLLWAVLAAFAASVALAAVQLVPTLELTRHSIGKYRADWLGSGGGAPLQALVSLVWPNFYGVFDVATYRQPFELTSMYLYCGGLTLIMAAWAVLRRNLAFSVLLVLSGLMMLGDSTPVGRVVYWALPVWLKVGLHPEFAAPAFGLALAVLAGLGLDRITGRAALRWAAVAVCACDLLLVSSGRQMHAMPRASEPGISRTHFDGQAATLERVRALSHDAFPPWRIDTIGNTLPWAMSAPTTQVPTANGNDPLAPARLIQVRLAFTKGERWGAYYEVQDTASPVLRMLNVRYLVSRSRLAGNGFAFREEVPGFSIYENAAALPRFWLAPRVRVARSEAEAAAMVRSPGFQPAVEAVVEGEPPSLPETGAGGGTVKVRRYNLKDLELEVDAPGWRWLASSETHYPGWRAWVDGVEQPLYYTNAAFRGMPVPPGKHRIVWRFEPRLLWWSGLVSLCAWLAGAALWLAAKPVPPGHASRPADCG